MKRNDWILIAAVLAVCAFLLGIRFLASGSGGMVEIYIDGDLYGTYPLGENGTVEINGTNRLEIKDGAADMAWADCPDKLCVHQKPISRDGESIICLPNKVVVSVAGGDGRKLDAVTN